jgi:hypothetical protein
MKPIILSMIVLGLFACGSKSNVTSYGEKFDTAKATTIVEALEEFKSSGQSEAVIKGKISRLCTGEGCWYVLKHDTVEQFVGFEKFSIPKDVAGMHSIAAGRFYMDTQSIESQREGLSGAEAAKITAPKVSVKFSAVGIVVR